ncbi:DUF3037 domain-containing protein [Leifsonia xyli]|uniref:DUF3037 domain-containing protein n=1 Tax=Leifsonia xyli TaxID=1575 RepID=UPI00159F1C6A
MQKELQYWIIRFVPNLTRGEFHNIGIVAGHDGGDWAAQFDIQLGRAAAGFSGDLRDLRSWIRWFERQITARPDALFDVGGVPATAWIEPFALAKGRPFNSLPRRRWTSRRSGSRRSALPSPGGT